MKIWQMLNDDVRRPSLDEHMGLPEGTIQRLMSRHKTALLHMQNIKRARASLTYRNAAYLDAAKKWIETEHGDLLTIDRERADRMASGY